MEEHKRNKENQSLIANRRKRPPATTGTNSELSADLEVKVKRMRLTDGTRKAIKSGELAEKLNVPRRDGTPGAERRIEYIGHIEECFIDLKVDSRFWVDFELVSVVGRGAYGCVVKAKHKKDGEIYAVKILESTETASREIKALAKLKHQNIVRYYTCWCEEAVWKNDLGHDDIISGKEVLCLFIQMEFCEKGTLKDWIQKTHKGTKKKLKTEKALDMFRQIVNGVGYIHSEGHIHRDLKPENVFIGKDDIVKIGDFGLVTVTSSTPLEHTVDKGTLLYMSPKQKRETDSDKKKDIYDLGFIFFEILWKMDTDQEKFKVFDDLHRQIFPKDFQQKHATEHYIIKKMLLNTAADRPDAKKISEYLGSFLLKPSTEIKQQSQ